MQDCIQTTISDEKFTALNLDQSIREWLVSFKTKSLMPKATKRQNIFNEYQKFILVKVPDWPTGGLAKWLANWKRILLLATQYGQSLEYWLRDVHLVWKQVPDLTTYFNDVIKDLSAKTTKNYTPENISAFISFV